jgi:signal transduction histidine kinase
LESSGVSQLQEPAARLLESRRADALAKYECGLRAAGSRLVLDATTLLQCLEQADRIFSDVTESLRRREVVFDANPSLTQEIAVSRASRSVHPDESFRAASSLFRVIMEMVAESVADDPDGVHLSRLAAEALNHSITSRIRAAATGYAGFLLHKIHEAHVDERRRIARELHDQVGHGISVANRHLELYEVYESRGLPGAAAKVAVARQALADTLDSIRKLACDLRLLAPLTSLDEALRHYLDAADTGETTVSVQVNGDETWISADGRDELFLIVREALRNALAHAGARAITVRIDIAPHELRAVVTDDGAGFDPGDTGSSGGTGLTSMRERAALLGSELDIASRPGRGTSVEILLPLPGVRDAENH